MVGGCAYIPFVRSRIEELLGIPVNWDIDPTNAIVVGAAYFAATKEIDLGAKAAGQRKVKAPRAAEVDFVEHRSADVRSVDQRMISDAARDFKITVKGLDERPDAPEGDIVYVVKDIFTTRDGSWEPSPDIPGSVTAWARERYLKPFGAADYFDDAGADHHLFALVLGLDGEPMAKVM